MTTSKQQETIQKQITLLEGQIKLLEDQIENSKESLSYFKNKLDSKRSFLNTFLVIAAILFTIGIGLFTIALGWLGNNNIKTNNLIRTAENDLEMTEILAHSFKYYELINSRFHTQNIYEAKEFAEVWTKYLDKKYDGYRDSYNKDNNNTKLVLRDLLTTAYSTLGLVEYKICKRESSNDTKGVIAAAIEIKELNPEHSRFRGYRLEALGKWRGALGRILTETEFDSIEVLFKDAIRLNDGGIYSIDKLNIIEFYFVNGQFETAIDYDKDEAPEVEKITKDPIAIETYHTIMKISEHINADMAFPSVDKPIKKWGSKEVEFPDGTMGYWSNDLMRNFYNNIELYISAKKDIEFAKRHLKDLFQMEKP